MEVNKIRFKDLPFLPNPHQVFYIENDYDAEANDFIRSNYADLKAMFASVGMDFYYMPYLLREHDIEARIRYYAPYLSSQVLVHEVESNVFVPYISDDDVREHLRPSFIFGGRQVDRLDEVRFLQVLLSDAGLHGEHPVSSLWQLVRQTGKADCFHELGAHKNEIQDSECKSFVSSCHEECAAEECKHIEAPREKDGKFSHLFRRLNGVLLSSVCFDGADENAEDAKKEDELAEKESLIETERVLSELRMAVQKLRLEGISLMAIHEFIDKQEPLSRMVITPDYRIFLPDYNNMEIEMGALPKAIYFLYLRYPQGIINKHMPDYFSELLSIYKQLRPNTDEARLNLTITKVVNPLGNALNENVARIRKAFVEKFDEHLANNYIITGERGLQYAVTLDRDLITWEE